MVKRLHLEINKNSSYNINCDSIPKGHVIEAAILSTDSVNPHTIADLVQDSYVDDIAVYIYYAAKAIRESLLEVSSNLKWLSEDNIAIPDMLCDWFAWVLTEGSSIRTISFKRKSRTKIVA